MRCFYAAPSDGSTAFAAGCMNPCLCNAHHLSALAVGSASGLMADLWSGGIDPAVAGRTHWEIMTHFKGRHPYSFIPSFSRHEQHLVGPQIPSIHFLRIADAMLFIENRTLPFPTTSTELLFVRKETSVFEDKS